MSTNKSNLTLYAYDIKTSNLTIDASAFFKTLKEVLQDRGCRSILGSRKMQLNKRDSEEDLLAYFSFSEEGYIFGTMMTLVSGAETGTVPEDMLKNTVMDLEELTKDGETTIKYRGVYYFAVSSSRLVVSKYNCAKRLSAYMNWLIDKNRGKNIYSFAPVIKEIPKIDIPSIKKIVFPSGLSLALGEKSNDTKMTFGAGKMTGHILQFLSEKNSKLRELVEAGVATANVVVNIEKKPKGMDKEEYNTLISSSIATDEDVCFIGKNDKKIKGSCVHLQRAVKIENTARGFVSEVQLKQEMESLLWEK